MLDKDSGKVLTVQHENSTDFVIDTWLADISRGFSEPAYAPYGQRVSKLPINASSAIVRHWLLSTPDLIIDFAEEFTKGPLPS